VDYSPKITNLFGSISFRSVDYDGKAIEESAEIAEFLEDPDIDVTKYSVKIELDFDSEHNPDSINLIDKNNPKELTIVEIDGQPVYKLGKTTIEIGGLVMKITIVDKAGKPVTINGKEVTAYVHRADYTRLEDTVKEEQQLKAKRLRFELYNRYVKGEREFYSNITSQRGGHILFSKDAVNNVKDLKSNKNYKGGENINLIIGDGKKRSRGKEIPGGSIHMTGFVDAIGEDATVPLKIREFTEAEVDAIYQLYLDLLQDKTFQSKVDNEFIQGITYKQALSLLVFEGETYTKVEEGEEGKDKQLYIKKDKNKPPKFYIGSNEYDLKEFEESEDAIKAAIKNNKKRNIIGKNLNTPLFGNLGAATEFTFFGKTYKKSENPNYNDLLLEGENPVLYTNIAVDTKTIFVQPTTVFNTDSFENTSKEASTPTVEISEDDIKMGSLEEFGDIEDDATPDTSISEEESTTDKTEEQNLDEEFEDLDEDSERPENFFRASTGTPKAKKNTTRSVQDEINKVKKLLPDTEEVVIDTIVNMRNKYGELLFGITTRDAITIAENAPKGTGYHEAFHRIFNYYLLPEERSKVLESAKREFTPDKTLLNKVNSTYNKKNNLSQEEIYDIAVEEMLADAFAEYIISREKKETGVIGKIFRFLESIINVFRSRTQSQKLFSKIEKGYFTTQERMPRNLQIVLSKYKSATELGMTTEQVNDVVDLMIFTAAKKAGIFEAATISNIQNFLDVYNSTTGKWEGELRNSLGASYKYSKKIGDTEKVQKLTIVLNNYGFFVKQLHDQLSNIGVKKKVDSESDLESAYNEELKGESLNINPKWEVSNEEKATTEIRLWLKLQPEVVGYDGITPVFNVDSYLGTPRFSHPGKIWNKIQKPILNTVNIVTGEGTLKVQEQIEEKLEKASEYDHQLKYILGQYNKFDAEKKNTFLKAFHNFDLNWRTDLWANGKYDIIDSANTSPSRKLLGEWEQGMLNAIFQVNKDGSVTPNKDKLLKIVDTLEANVFPIFTDLNFPKLKTDGNIDQTKVDNFYDSLVESLNGIGVKVSKEDLVSFGIKNRESLKSGDTVSTLLGLKDFISTLKFVVGSGKNIGNLSLKSLATRSSESFLNVNKKELAKAEVGVSKNSIYELFKRKNFISNEKTTWLPLAELVSSLDSEAYENTVYGPENKPYQRNSAPSFLMEHVEKIKQGDIILKTLAEKYPKSVYLQRLLKDENFRTQIFGYTSFLASREEGDKGKSFTDMTPAETLLSMFNSVISGKSIAEFPTLNMADKSMYQRLIWEAPNPFDVVEYVANRVSITEETEKVFVDYAIGELTAIYKSYFDVFGTKEVGDTVVPDFKKPGEGHLGKDRLIYNKHYKVGSNNEFIYLKGNAFQNQLFPELSYENLSQTNPELADKLYKEVGGVNIPLEEVHAGAYKEIGAIISDKLNRIIDEGVQDFESNGLISRRGSLLADNTRIGLLTSGRKESIAKELNIEKGNTKDSRVLEMSIATFEIAMLQNYIEQTFLLHGDLASYKSFEDFRKRTPAIKVDGTKLNTAHPEVRDNFNMQIIMDREIKSKLYDTYTEYFQDNKDIYGRDGESTEAYKDRIEKSIAPLKSVNTGDAQGYITIDRWKEILVSTEYWTPDKQEAYENYKAGKEPNFKDLIVFAQPIKGVYSGFDAAGNFVYIKYSQSVLHPSMLKSTYAKELAVIAEDMENSSVDELVFLSGGKVGISGLKNVFDEKGNYLTGQDYSTSKMEMSNDNWRLQVENPTKTSGKMLDASQQRKNMLLVANTPEEKQKFHDIHTALTNIGLEEFFGSSGINRFTREVENMSAFVKFLQTQFATRNIPDLVKRSLELQDGKTFLDLTASPYKDSIQPIVFAAFNKQVIKYKVPGMAAIQVASVGIKPFSEVEGAEMLVDDNYLKGPRINKETGMVEAAQVLLPSHFKNLIPDAHLMTNEEIREFFKDNKELLNGIGYRIPTQGVSSIDEIEIVGFLPQSMGNTVVVYEDITAKTGSDFDIDKMYVMFPNFKKNKDGKPELVPFYDNETFDANVEEIIEDLLKNRRDLVRVIGLVSETEEQYETLLDEIIYNVEELYELNEEVKEFYKSDEIKKQKAKIKELKYERNKRVAGATEYDPEIKRLNKEINGAYEILNTFISENTTTTLEIKQEVLESTIETLKPLMLSYEGNKLELNTKKAVQNSKFDVYKELLRKPENFLTLVTSLDAVTLKYYLKDVENAYSKVEGEAKALGITDFVKREGLEEFTNYNQLYLKSIFTGGKDMVGMAANQVSNIALADGMYLAFDRDYGVGISEDGKTTLSQKISLDGTPVMGESNAVLNGSVDVAKDPVIYKVGITPYTINAAFALIRSGAGLEYTSAFLSQPIIKVLGKEISKADSGLMKRTQGKTYDGLEGTRKMFESRAEALIKQIYPDIEKQYEELNKFKSGVESVVTKQEHLGAAKLLKEIEKLGSENTETLLEFYKTQLALLDKFEKLLEAGKDLSLAVTAAKPDVDGAGKNITETKVAKGKKEFVERAGRILGFESFFDGTFVGASYENAIETGGEIMSQLFIEGTPAFNDFVNKALTYIGKEDFRDYDTINTITKEAFSYFINGFEPFSRKGEDKNLFFGKDSLVKQISRIKYDSSHPLHRNFLISNLEAIPNLGFSSNPDILKMRNTKGIEDMLSNSLFELYINDEYKQLALDIIKVAYITSGYNKNMNSFYNIIAPEIFKEEKYAEFIEFQKENVLQTPETLDAGIEQMFRHRHIIDNDTIVSSISSKGVNTLLKNPKDNSKPFILEIRNFEYMKKLLVGKDESGNYIYRQYIKLGKVPYKFKGLNIDGNPIYTIMDSLGYYSKSDYIYEYSRTDITPKTFLEYNKNRPQEDKAKLEIAEKLKNLVKIVPGPKKDLVDKGMLKTLKPAKTESGKTTTTTKSRIIAETSPVKGGVSELFESNPELANAVYEALGFVQEVSINDIILETESDTGLEQSLKELDETRLSKDFIELSIHPQGQNTQGKKYVVSDGWHRLAKAVKNNDKTIKAFVGKVAPQKQQAQSKFQEYVNATGKQDIEGFKEFTDKHTSDIDPAKKLLNKPDGLPAIKRTKKTC
jgi:hypothetical protein